MIRQILGKENWVRERPCPFRRVAKLNAQCAALRLNKEKAYPVVSKIVW